MLSRKKLFTAAFCLAACSGSLHATTLRLTDDSNTTVGSTEPQGTKAGSVSKATLRVFVNTSDKTGGTFNVQSLHGTWNEDAITGANAPALGGKGGAGAISGTGSPAGAGDNGVLLISTVADPSTYFF